MFSPLYLDNFISATRITPQVGKRARRARRPRRSKLRIFRFRASTKAQSLRCFSSPHKAVRLCGVPKTGERETHRGQPWQAASCRPICLDTQCPACTQDRLPWLGLKAVETPVTGCEDASPVRIAPQRRGASCKYGGNSFKRTEDLCQKTKNITT